jgi:hypothetical protein
MPEEHDNKFGRLWEAMSAPMADILKDAWTKGLCEGLELSVNYAETFAQCSDIPPDAQAAALTLANALRQCQLSVQIDEIEGSNA